MLTFSAILWYGLGTFSEKLQKKEDKNGN